jgi:hypothetical protein
MSFQHNLMAHQVSAVLLQQLRTGRAPWANGQLTAKTTLWQGMSDWPKPDIAFEDRSANRSLALEFKPPNQPKREYVTGLGQVFTYLNDFEYAGLVVPELAADGFNIGKYFLGILANVLNPIPVALFTYGHTPAELRVLQPLKANVSPRGKIPAGIGRKVFWGYWRDLSNYDLLTLLSLSDYPKRGGFDPVFRKYWKQYAVKGKAWTWENTQRKCKRVGARSYPGEKENAFLAMRHAGLLTAEGHLTGEGYALLRVGKIYGAGSVAFVEELARQILTTGRHLDLIFWVEEQQRFISVRRKKSAAGYYRALDRNLSQEGIIAPRNKASAKPYFLRDEPKLWNKLGLLIRKSGEQYFHPGHGLVFNWRRIVSLLEMGNSPSEE